MDQQRRIGESKIAMRKLVSYVASPQKATKQFNGWTDDYFAIALDFLLISGNFFKYFKYGPCFIQQVVSF